MNRQPLIAVVVASVVATMGTPASAAAPNRLLAGPPYLGVACPVANRTSCDRVGLAVWLRKPARSVVASMGGRSFRLDDPTWSGPRRNGLRRMFAGFQKPAGLRRGPLRIPTTWTGLPPVKTRVRIRVTLASGAVRTTRVTVGLSPGWG